MISEKAYFQAKIIAKHTEQHYGICQENITILDTYVPNSKPSKICERKKDKSITTAGDFNSPLKIELVGLPWWFSG